MPDNAKLTDQEIKIIDTLAAAYELHNDLPIQHPMHQSEFCESIHVAQRIVMSRLAARQHKWLKDDNPYA